MRRQHIGKPKCAAAKLCPNFNYRKRFEPRDELHVETNIKWALEKRDSPIRISQYAGLDGIQELSRHSRTEMPAGHANSVRHYLKSFKQTRHKNVDPLECF